MLKTLRRRLTVLRNTRSGHLGSSEGAHGVQTYVSQGIWWTWSPLLGRSGTAATSRRRPDALYQAPRVAPLSVPP